MHEKNGEFPLKNSQKQNGLIELKALMSERAPLKTKRTLGEFLPLGQVNAGQLVEVLGMGRFSWAVQLLKEWSHTRAVWASSEKIELCPMALAQEQIALSRLLFLEQVKPEQGMDVILTVLRAQLFEVVVFEQALLPRRNLDAQIRKLQLTAEEGGCLLLLLSRSPTVSFGVTNRIDTEVSAMSEKEGERKWK